MIQAVEICVLGIGMLVPGVDDMEHVGTVTLETERLVLRPWAIEDAGAMYGHWATDPVVTEFMIWPPHEDIEESRRVIGAWVAERKRSDRYEWCVVPKAVGEARGSLGVVMIDEATGTVELGYCLARECWGMGYMPEAVRAVIDLMFGTVGVRRVIAKHDVDNLKSGRVMQKAGMRYLETRAGGVRNNRGLRDVVVYAIDNPAYPDDLDVSERV